MVEYGVQRLTYFMRCARILMVVCGFERWMLAACEAELGQVQVERRWEAGRQGVLL